MRLLDQISTPGGVLNEDRAGFAGTIAWVIDGATDIQDSPVLPGLTDVQWLVDCLAFRLARAGCEQYRGDGVALLREIADAVEESMRRHRFPPDRLPPACSLVLLVDRGADYELVRIGDATAIARGARTTRVSTDYFDRREAKAAGHHPGGLDSADARTGIERRRLSYMVDGGMESVFSGHPARQLRPHRVVVDWSDTDVVLLCSDGLARLITDYGIYQGWEDLMVAAGQGLRDLEQQARGVERGMAEPSVKRFKKADDIAAVLIGPTTTAGRIDPWMRDRRT